MSKVWLITGSSRGFGRALAEAVLGRGNKLVATARNPAHLKELIRHYRDQVQAVALDVTNARAAADAVKAAVEKFGRLDVVVNNAGYGDVASVEDMAEPDFRAQMETNFFGVVNVTRAAVPLLRKQGSGHFIQFSSIGGRIGSAGLSAYQAAKFAVAGFSEVLAKEIGPLGVKVTIIEPSSFRTDWAGSSMKIPDIRPEYEPTVGLLAKHVRASDGNQPGDPAKAARIILELVDNPEPPLHLLLGRHAVEMAEAYAKALAASDAKWREVGISADFDNKLAASSEKWDCESPVPFPPVPATTARPT